VKFLQTDNVAETKYGTKAWDEFVFFRAAQYYPLILAMYTATGPNSTATAN
jgi:hypothetical protein